MMVLVLCLKSGKKEWANVSPKTKKARCTKCGETH